MLGVGLVVGVGVADEQVGTLGEFRQGVRPDRITGVSQNLVAQLETQAGADEGRRVFDEVRRNADAQNVGAEVGGQLEHRKLEGQL